MTLNGCGGSGGSSGPTVPRTAATATATPSPAPTLHPIVAGESFTYAGSLSETFVRPPLTTAPTPDPNPSSSQTLSANVTVNVVTSTGKSFNGVGNLVDFTANETDAYATPPETLTSVADDYVLQAFGATSGTLSNVGSSITTSAGAAFVTEYGSGNGLIDVLPDAPGPILPANNAALTKIETDADGTKTTRVTNPDGTYTQNASIPGALTSTALENADGSGTYSFPLKAQVPNTVVAVSAPSAGMIPILITYNPSISPAVTRSVPVWYPATPPVLSKETYVDGGRQPLPAACNTAAVLVQPVNALTQTISSVDTIFGETETWSSTSYVASGSTVLCAQLSDVTVSYYDYSGQTPRYIATGNTPQQTATLAETLSLQSATTSAQSARSPVIAAATAGFRALVDLRRTQRHAAMLSRPLRKGSR